MKPVLNNYFIKPAILVISRINSMQLQQTFKHGSSRRKLLVLLGLILTCITNSGRADTLKVVTFAAFYDQIKAHHPVVRQAALLPEQAQQELRIARGNFDPQAISYYDRKNFKNQLYYDNWNSLVKIPLWFGADLKAGFERNKGVNVNPEEKTPAAGLTYAGISLPIGQGWLIDQRRATLRQAQLLINAAEADKIKNINKLLLEAAKDYWDWVLAYQRWQLYQTAYNLSEVRYRGVAERARYGDLAAIDTVEARLDLINRQQLLQQSLTEFQNSRLIVSNYLWTPDQTPVELVSAAVPAFKESDLNLIPADTLQQLLRFAQENHPELRKLDFKYKQLEIERRLAADKFKPKLNLEYNFLRQDFGLPLEGWSNDYLSNNYKLGLSFSYPLLLRSERGKWQLTRFKLTETNLAQTQAQREIATSLQTTYNELQMLASQLKTQETLITQAEILRNGEQTRFENGESSLFLVNTREMNLINQNLKFWELKTKYVKSIALLYWSAGNMDLL